jgi:hypothetical protein
MNLESFLNFVIPTAVLLFLFGTVWWKLKEPMGALFKWFGELLGWTKDKISESASTVNTSTEIVYK